MRKFFWQRWALIFMLVSRLVIGELGHAMPVAPAEGMGAGHHHQMAMDMSSDASAGADLDGSNHSMPVGHHESADSSDHSTGEQDCCKSGECECPCLHAPCASLDVLFMTPVATSLLRIPHGADGLVSLRPSGLFRPPA